jgi:hypothetical protein
MIGQRVYANPDGYLPHLRLGEYGRLAGEPLTRHLKKLGWNGWYCCTPTGRQGNVGAHKVEEHEDGTITVSPSILIRPIEAAELLPKGRDGWHGYLERGVWRRV